MNSVNFNMLQSLKPFTCCKCTSSFTGKDISRFHSVPRFPRILSCSHTACENCLHFAEKNHTMFQCTICNAQTNLIEIDDFSKLPPDVYALGIISANLKNALPSLKIKMVPSNEIKRNQSKEFSTKLIGPTILCGDCNNNLAIWCCEECQLNFCSLCFKEKHEGKPEQNHKGRKIFAEAYNSIVQEGCPDHANKVVEFYCEVDDQLTCSYCMLMGKHMGHQVKTLVDKNKSCAEDLKVYLESAYKIQKHLKYADHMLCEIIPKEKVDISGTIKTVHEYFHRLHTLLQRRESEFISELTEVSQKHIKPLEEMRLRITSLERDLETLKKDAEAVIENPFMALSAPAILNKLKEAQDYPCYVVPLVDESERNYNLAYHLEDELEKKIQQLGEIQFNIKPRYTLTPSSDLPENFVTDIPESFLSKLNASSTAEFENPSSVTNETFSEDSLSIKSCKSSHQSSIQASFKCKDISKLQPEEVVVSHIKTPSCFFVQRQSGSRKLKLLSDTIDRWCKSSESRKSIVSAVELGDMYLVRFSADGKWYRGRATNIISQSDELFPGEQSIGKKSPLKAGDGKVQAVESEPLVEVFYVDYGNTEKTSLKNIKCIQPRFLHASGYAKECCLLNITPAKENEWCKEAIKSFTKFVCKKPVVMKVFEEVNNVLHVDLSQNADNNVSNDVPVSVRDALVFAELAVFPSGLNTKKKKIKNERSYLPPEPLLVNSNICAIVTHIDNPFHFYVQQLSTAAYLSKLIHDMNNTYNDENTLLHSVYAPRVGMAVAAQFSVDKQWYRAKVLELPGGAKVEVQYIDFGNREVLHHKHLRKLFDKFMKLNIQVLPCRLAYVTYNQAKCWSKEVTEWFLKTVSKKQLTLHSIGNVPGENKAEVVLTYVENNSEICVNSLMVEKGFAESATEIPLPARVKLDIDSPEQTNRKEKLQLQMEVGIPPPFQGTLDCVQNWADRCSSPELVDDDMVEVAISHVQSPPQKKFPTLVATPPDDTAERIEVHISHIVSPGHFYVRIAGEAEKKLEVLMAELQDFYKNLDEPIECSVGKGYAVYSQTLKKWHRGTVLEKISDDKLKIQFVDYGVIEVIEKSNISKLKEEFATHEAFSVLCHFDGIIPTGGSTWSNTSCDRFTHLVLNHDVLILSSKGEVEKESKSLPVDILIENLNLGGALEPTKIEYTSIKSELLKMGLAMPSHRRSTPPKVETNSESPTLPISNYFEPIPPPKRNQRRSRSEKAEYLIVAPIDTVSKEEPKFRWKPAVPPLESNFRGKVTNVGEDGSIHLHIISTDSSSQVETIQKALEFKYNQTTYQRLTKMPPIGEALIAKFSIDNGWYRAEVVSLYPNRQALKVNYVDYGNNEVLSLGYVRSDISMTAFPRLCLECALAGFTPDNGQWDSSLLNFLHHQIVEKEVAVEVVGATDSRGRLPCKISLSGMDIAELLQNLCFDGAADVDSSTSITAKTRKCDSFASPEELREGDIFPVCVPHVSSETIVYLQRLKIPEPKDTNDEKHNENYDKFLELIADMRKDVDTFPQLEEPLPRMPCCAKYSYDKNWYRCEITDLTEDGAVVLYVDYGNSEVVPFEHLRKIDSHYLDFPMQIHYCELHGIKPVGSDWNPITKDVLISKLQVADQELYARVVIPGKISQVDLLLKTKDEKYKLAYEELVEMELIELKKTVSL